MKRISRFGPLAASASLAGLISVGLATGANANPYGHAGYNQYGDLAQVISSTPVYERVSTPRRECYVEQVATYEERRHARRVYDDRHDNRYDNRGQAGIGPGTVLGAVIGGAIGRQFGNSSGGRDRGTAAGAIIGGVIGNDIERNGRYDNYQRASSREYVEVERVPVTRNVERCRTVADYRDEVRGYDVRYRYHGREYTTRMSYDPGPTMPVNVDVRPNTRQPVPVYSRTY
jgi:uncharacterized protein YcfJ